MLRLAEMAAAIGLILSLLLLIPAHQGTPLLVLLCIAGVSLAGLVGVAARRRSRARTLPSQLARLAYRSDEQAVAFVWQWRGRREHRLRILRSEVSSAGGADEGVAGAQTLVYDGSGEEVVDDGVAPRRAYHYSLFVGTASGGWSTPVRVYVLTLSRPERLAIEASYAARPGEVLAARRGAALSGLMVPDPVGDPHGVQWSRGGASLLGDALGGLATDAILTATEVFAGRRPDDDWEDVT